MSFSWTCPFCKRDTTIVGKNIQNAKLFYDNPMKEGEDYFYVTQVITCPNRECGLHSVSLSKHDIVYTVTETRPGAYLQTWKVVPESNSIPMPSYVPKPITEDYYEACLIRDKSPKASATLSRRALQGMIRDFWGISKSRLVDEIDAIKDKTDPITWSAIDAVRKIGNIGAHMEKDINIIVDVDPPEAQLLIGLIETLIKDWYIARHEREESMNKLIALSQLKDDQKKGL